MRPAHAPIALVCLLLSACASKPPRIADARLAGSWRNAEGVTISAEDTGVFAMMRPGPRQRPIVGEYTFDGESAVFRFRSENRLCGDDPGEYALKFAEGSFTASATREPCDERRKMLDGAWIRTAAGRVTPGS